MSGEAEKAGKRIRDTREWKRKRESIILTLAIRTPVALIVAIVVLNGLVSVWNWKAIAALILILALIGEAANEWRIRKLERKNWELEDELQILRAYKKVVTH